MSPGCFKQIALEHKDRLYTYAAWLLGDREEARDVTQEALMRLWSHREQVAAEAARAWLLRTAHRLCVDRIRRRARQAHDLRGQLHRLIGEPPPAPDDGAHREERRAALGRALLVLSTRDRAIILLRERYGLGYQELCRVMDMPMGSMKAALSRARERLREAMHPVEVPP